MDGLVLLPQGERAGGDTVAAVTAGPICRRPPLAALPTAPSRAAPAGAPCVLGVSASNLAGDDGPGNGPLARVEAAKAKIADARAREARARAEIEREVLESEARVERLRREIEAERLRLQSAIVAPSSAAGRAAAEAAAAEAELKAAVAAPVASGRDPFELLPDELLEHILLMVHDGTLCSGVIGRVCRRWAALCQGGPVRRAIVSGRWCAYGRGALAPASLDAASCHFGAVNAMCVAPNGTLFCGSSDDKISVWAHGPPATALADGHGALAAAAVAPHGSGGNHLCTLRGHTSAVLCLALSPDAATLYSGSSDKTVVAWCASTWAVQSVMRGHTEAVKALCVADDGSVFSGGYDSAVCKWAGGSAGEPVGKLTGHSGTVFALAVTSCGGGRNGVLFSASLDGTVRVWRASDGAALQTLQGHRAAVVALAVAPDGATLYSGGTDCTVRVWSRNLVDNDDGATDGDDDDDDDGGGVGNAWTCTRVLEKHTRPVASLAVADGGDVVVSGGWDHTVQLWSAESGEARETLRGHRGTVVAVAAAPGGELYSASADGSLCRW